MSELPRNKKVKGKIGKWRGDLRNHTACTQLVHKHTYMYIHTGTKNWVTIIPRIELITSRVYIHCTVYALIIQLAG